jgi:hypothetical protein
MLVQVMMEAMSDGGVCGITSILATSSTKSGLMFVPISHVKVLHFFHGI